MDFLLYFALYGLYAVIAVTLFFSTSNLLKRPEQLKRIGLIVGLLLVLFLISYLLAPANAVTDAVGNLLMPEGSASKWVSALLLFGSMLSVIGLGTVIWGLFRKSTLQ